MHLNKLQQLRTDYLASVSEAKDLLKEGKVIDYMEKLRECDKLSMMAKELNLAFCN